MKKLIIILILFCSIQVFGQSEIGAQGYYRLNGDSNDASGNAYNGTNTSITFSQANGRLNQGAGFNGSSSKIEFSSQVIPLGVKTISYWFKSTNTNLYKVIVDNSRSNDTSLHGTYMDVRATTGRPMIYSCKGTSGIPRFFVTIPVNVTDGKWHHIVFTWDGTTNANGIKGYLDGVLKIQGTAASTETTNASYNLNIGYALDVAFTQGRMLGSLDELIIDNTAWSAAKVKNEYIKMLGLFSN